MTLGSECSRRPASTPSSLRARARARGRASSRSPAGSSRAPRRRRASSASKRAHGSYEALLADPDVDAVYISLPNEMHHEWTMQAIAAGKHVLCEKPYSRSAAASEEAFAAAEAAGVVLAEAFMWRHHPQALQLAELVADGAIGELRLVRAAFSFLLDDPRDVRLLEELDGGGTDGRRLLLRQRRAHARRRARERHRAAAARAVGRRPAPRRDARPRAATSSRTSTARSTCPIAATSRSSARRASCASAIPGTASRTGIELVRGDGATEHFEIPPANPYGCELDDFAGAVAGEHPPRLGAGRRPRPGAHDRRRAARPAASGQLETSDASGSSDGAREREAHAPELAPQQLVVEAAQRAVPAVQRRSGRRPRRPAWADVGCARSSAASSRIAAGLGRELEHRARRAGLPELARAAFSASRARQLERAGDGAHAPRREATASTSIDRSRTSRWATASATANVRRQRPPRRP